MYNTIKQTPLQKVLHFFLAKMIVGIVVIVSLVALIEWLGSLILDKTIFSDDLKALIVALTQAFIATQGYIFLFRAYDKRQVRELHPVLFLDNAVTGFMTGILLQALFIFIIYLAGSYLVEKVNPASTLISPFAFALTAGFVAEIIIIGIVFRILEQQIGTRIALLIFIVLFAIFHINARGATFISVGATAMNAGLMLPAAYVFSRNLWLPVFLHFGWDFAEPGIFGGINPSSSLKQGLLTSKISGNLLITGGETGPQNSLSSLLLCLLLGVIFLFLAKRKNNLIKPNRRTSTTNISIRE